MFALYKWYNSSIFECCCWLSLCVDAREIYINLQNEHFSKFCTKVGYKKYFNVMIKTFENICVLGIYVIVLRPILVTTYTGKKSSEYTCELYIINWSYSKKIGIVFAI